MDKLILLVLGLSISAIGIMNIRGNVNTIHAYHRKRVRKEDLPKYGKTIGTGTLLIGASLVLSFVVAFWNDAFMAYIVIPAIVIGLAIMIYGQIKYNHGIF